MSGYDLIRLALDSCSRAKIPPTDAAILNYIRAQPNLFELKKGTR